MPVKTIYVTKEAKKDWDALEKLIKKKNMRIHEAVHKGILLWLQEEDITRKKKQ